MSSGAARWSPDDPRGPGRPAFQDVYTELHSSIRRYLRSLVGPSEAEDLTQEVFVKVAQALPRFRGDSKVSTWVYRIAANAAFDRLRCSSFRGTARGLLQIGRCVPDGGADAERALVRKEMNECIRGHIDALPAIYRSVVLLSEDAGLSNQEIAEALGVTLETVKIRLHRARARLKKALAGGCSLYRDERNELSCEPKIGGVSPAG